MNLLKTLKPMRCLCFIAFSIVAMNMACSPKKLSADDEDYKEGKSYVDADSINTQVKESKAKIPFDTMALPTLPKK